MKNLIVGILGLVGFMLIAGSAGDCDGACMDQANTMGEMLTLIMLGFLCLGGAVGVAKWGGE
jgi:hypothetical protein